MFPFRRKRAAQDSAAVTPAAGPALALIAEDEPILRMNAEAILEEMGFAVLSVNTAAEAIAVLEANTIELLITDIRMPGDVDGLALARTAVERWPDVRIVVCSGHRRATAADLPAGAVFVAKPYTMDDIENAVLSL